MCFQKNNDVAAYSVCLNYGMTRSISELLQPEY
jgi:hypothetical protein